jgi:dienelactone hydrolase
MIVRALLSAVLLTFTPAPAVAAPAGTGVAVYDLGDTAFFPDGFAGPNELRAVVHFPHTGGRHPLIIQLHGMWWTCVDTTTREPTMDWPCQQEIPSYLGYDYLGEALARKGFVVVSIGANGINSANPGGAYTDRARLINEHLRMWQQLSVTGGGPLAGHFVDKATGRPVRMDAEVDMTKVGTMGHSRGGMAAMLHASEPRNWPAGVRVRAVFGAAPVYNWAEPVEVTNLPFAILNGTCDVIQGTQYFDDVAGRNHAPIHQFDVAGANHNFLNTQWSPSGGQPGAEDDAVHDGLPPGQCTNGHTTPARQLSESEEHSVAAAYAVAFFERYLMGDRRYDPMLQGRTGIPQVSVRYVSAS